MEFLAICSSPGVGQGNSRPRRDFSRVLQKFVEFQESAADWTVWFSQRTKRSSTRVEDRLVRCENQTVQSAADS